MASFTGCHHTSEAKERIKSKLQTLFLLDPEKRERCRVKSLGNLSRTGQKLSVEEKNKHRLPSEIIEYVKTFRSEGLTHKQIAINLNEKGMFNKYGKQWKTKSISSVFERIRKEIKND